MSATYAKNAGCSEFFPPMKRMPVVIRPCRFIDQGCKYPPAKPGALEFWPLKAAGKVADAASGCVSRSKRLVGGADATPGSGGH